GGIAGGDGLPGAADRGRDIEPQSKRGGIASATGASGMSIRGADRITLPNLRNDHQFCSFRARADRGEPLGAADGDSVGADGDHDVLERALYCDHGAAGLSAVEFDSRQVLFVAAAGFWSARLGVENLDSRERARWMGMIHGSCG